jgi:hypothetical protein
MRLCCILLLLTVMEARAAFEPAPQGARSVALGGAASSLQQEPWAPFMNPASIATLARVTVAVYHLPGLFGLPEIARTSFSVVVPSPWGTAALAGSRFGFPLYKESSLLFACARSLSPGLFAGATVAWSTLSIPGYGSTHVVAFHAGLQAEIGERLVYGFSVTNINAPSIGAAGERAPQQVCTGASYAPFDGSMVIVETEKMSGAPLDVRLAVECAPLAPLVFRAGFTTEPAFWSTGIGVRLAALHIDYTVTLHPDLGLTHHMSLDISLGVL